MAHPAQNLPVFTSTIAGRERHDGEKPYTYVVRAPNLSAAEEIATAIMVEDTEADVAWTGDGVVPCEPDVEIVRGERHTFAGAPDWSADTPGWNYTDARDDPRVLELALKATLGDTVKLNGAFVGRYPIKRGPVMKGANKRDFRIKNVQVELSDHHEGTRRTWLRVTASGPWTLKGDRESPTYTEFETWTSYIGATPEGLPECALLAVAQWEKDFAQWRAGFAQPPDET